MSRDSKTLLAILLLVQHILLLFLILIELVFYPLIPLNSVTQIYDNGIFWIQTEGHCSIFNLKFLIPLIWTVSGLLAGLGLGIVFRNMKSISDGYPSYESANKFGLKNEKLKLNRFQKHSKEILYLITGIFLNLAIPFSYYSGNYGPIRDLPSGILQIISISSDFFLFLARFAWFHISTALISLIGLIGGYLLSLPKISV